MSDFDYKGEVLLLRWSETPAGRQVTFLLPEDGTEHPFKGFKAGAKYGQPFAVICQAIDYDNPKPEDGEVKTVAGYARKPMGEAQRCGMLCADEGFQRWIFENLPNDWQKAIKDLGQESSREDRTIRVIKQHCGIASRKELDREGVSQQHWQRLLQQYEAR